MKLDDLYSQMTANVREYYIYRILKSGSDEWVDNIKTPAHESLDDIILASFKDCINSLSAEYGDESGKMEMG